MSDQRDHIRIGKHSALIPSRTHTYANNTPFYASVPYPFQQYYMRHVRQWLQWYDGYVDWFHTHDQGVFSTRLAYTVLHKLAKQTVGKRILFDGERKGVVEDIEKWAKKDKLTQKLKRAVEWAYAGGDSLLKLDLFNRELSTSVIRKDNYWVEIGFDGKIKQANILLYTYTNMLPNVGSEFREIFYVFEERKYGDKGEPLWRLTLKRGSGHGVSHKNVDYSAGDHAFRDLPRSIRDKLVKDYPNIKFNEWQDSPLKSIGVYMIKATEGVSFVPSLQFGESLLSNTMDILMSFDFYYSAFNTDIYMGRGKVMLPSQMSNPHEMNDDFEHFTGLDSFFYEMIPYVSPEQQKPQPIQFDLRQEDWQSIRNQLIQMLATKLGVSERTLATYVVPASEKPSAYEISSDEDATAAFIEDKREMLQCEIDYLLEDVLHYYNHKSDVYCKFSKVGLTNINNIINQVAIMRQNGIIDMRTSLEWIFPDKTDKQIEDMIERIRVEQKEKATIKGQEQTDPIQQVTEGIKSQITMRQTKTLE